MVYPYEEEPEEKEDDPFACDPNWKEVLEEAAQTDVPQRLSENEALLVSSGANDEVYRAMLSATRVRKGI